MDSIKGQRIGLARPPVILLPWIWIALAPYFFSLHTVRVLPSDVAAARDDLGEFFTKWASACAPPDGSTVRPIIVAVSGCGASRAAVWGASVLQKVEEASPTQDTGQPCLLRSAASQAAPWVSRPIVAFCLCATFRSTNSAPRDRPRRAQGPDGLMARQNAVDSTHDALGPLLAATVAVDAPRALLKPVCRARPLDERQ